jgi:hypothetical protein
MARFSPSDVGRVTKPPENTGSNWDSNTDLLDLAKF